MPPPESYLIPKLLAPPFSRQLLYDSSSNMRASWHRCVPYHHRSEWWPFGCCTLCFPLCEQKPNDFFLFFHIFFNDISTRLRHIKSIRNNFWVVFLFLNWGQDTDCVVITHRNGLILEQYTYMQKGTQNNSSITTTVTILIFFLSFK